MANASQENNHPAPRSNLWQVAVSTAHQNLPADLRDLGSDQNDTTAILHAISQAALDRQEEAKKKQWKIQTKTGKTLLVRDLWGDVLGWVKKFQAIGDALVRTLLTAAIGEHETHTQMVEGMEFVCGLIVQYAVVEQLYTSGPSQLTIQLQKSLTELYVSILLYLFYAYKYFGYNKIRRALSGVNKSMNGEVNQLQKKITEAKTRVDADASLIHHDLTHSGISILAWGQASLTAKGAQVLEHQAVMVEQHDQIMIAQEDQAERSRILVEILQSWQRPLHLLSSQALDIHEVMDQAKTTKISEWLSSVRVDTHHAEIRDGRLPSSGKWLLQHAVYQDWARYPFIDEYQTAKRESRNEHVCLAYFYCTRNKAGFDGVQELNLASEPVEIFRSLLKQLVKTEGSKKLDVSVTDKYQQLDADVDEPRRLTMFECIELIVSISWDRPTTIIIDALDECRSANVRDLLKGLDEIILRSPKTVKILMSTRPVSAVIDCLRDKQYASLEVNADLNGDDISNFITHELDSRIREKQLLRGLVSNDLRRDILLSLTKRAGSMFWYASLQLNLLCDPAAEQDEISVRAKLTELPGTLKEVYASIIDEITSMKNSESSRDMAQNSLKWLLCAQESLPCDTFLEAISSKTGQNLESEQVISICRSLVSRDAENDSFEFSHLSVREHLEQEEQYNLSECHLVAAGSCLRALENFHRSSAVNRNISDSAKALNRYASLYWPLHFQGIDFGHTDDRKERLRSRLKALLVHGRDVSAIFKQWISDIKSIAATSMANQEHLAKLDSLRAVPATPLFAASIFGFADLIRQFRTTPGYDLEQVNVRKQGALCLAVANDQLETVKAFLEDLPRAKVRSLDVNQINICAIEQYEENDANLAPEVICFATALQAAAFNGNMSISRYLLGKGARIDLMAGFCGNALQAAAMNGHVELVNMFLDYGAEPNSQGGYFGNALQAAAHTGDRATVEALIDYGAFIPTPGGHYGTALMAAVESRNKEVVELLINGSKKQINRASRRYGTPLQRAAELDCFGVVELLVSEGAQMNVQSSDQLGTGQLAHSSALAAAAWSGHSKIVSILLSNGAQADMGHQDEEMHLLHQAASQGMLALAEYCIDTFSCDIDMMTNSFPVHARSGKLTPLSFACSEGQTQMVRFLLDRGAALEFEDDNCFTLWLAARRGHAACLRLLLEHSKARKDHVRHSQFVNRHTPSPVLWRFKPDSQDTALHGAARIGSVDCVELLLAHGAKYEINQFHENAIYTAVTGDRPRVVEMLAKHAGSSHCEGGSPIDARDAPGNTPLYHAVVDGYTQNVRILLNSGANANIRYHAGDSVLHLASKGHRVQVLQEFLAFQESFGVKAQLDHVNDAGNTPLVEALVAGCYGAAVLLLERGAIWPDNEHQTRVLHQAALTDKSRVHEYMSTFDAFPTQLSAFLASIDNDGKTALHIAAEVEDVEAVSMLLRNGAPLGLGDFQGNTPLMLAMNNDADHCARTILEFADKAAGQAEPLINRRNHSLNTALHQAVLHGRAALVRLLIDFGADITILGHNNNTTIRSALLHCTDPDAAQRFATTIIPALLQKAHADGECQLFIDSCTDTGGTVLLEACERGLYDVAQTLLIYGADCFLSNHKAESPLHVVAKHGAAEFAQFMLEHLTGKYGPELVHRFINQRDQDGMTALHEACRVGSSGMVKLLVGKYEADYTLAANEGGVFSEYTPLHNAIWSGSAPLVQTLLEHVACDTDAGRKQSFLDAYHSRDGEDSTALLYATAEGRADMVMLLLTARVDYLLPDKARCTALHKSVSNNNISITRALLEFVSQDKKHWRESFLNHRNHLGKTALMDAVERDLAPIIRLLLRYPDTEYSIQDAKGFTALHWGTCRDKRAAVKVLLDLVMSHGTGYNAAKVHDFINHRAHYNGRSALFDAAVNGHVEIAKVLLNFGADYETMDNAGYNPLHVAVEKDYCEMVQLYHEFAWQADEWEKFERFAGAKEPASGLTLYEIAMAKGSTEMKRAFQSFAIKGRITNKARQPSHSIKEAEGTGWDTPPFKAQSAPVKQLFGDIRDSGVTNSIR
ncbi:MAG: hypothetical protein Q9208_001235 [Pyrenodesmia sp. 3 TL-2023]